MHKRLVLAVLAAAAPLPALAQESPARDNIDALIEAHAKAQGIPASLVHRVVKRESNYNPRARGHGGALGLMQIKHGTARAMGYGGSPAGLLDARVNLTYGIAYLAGAYRTARGNEAQAYSYYARGYYYDAKRAGVRTEIAELQPAPAPSSTAGNLFGRLFGGGPQAPAVATAAADPNALALSNAMAAGAQGAAAQPAEAIIYTVPLPPSRPVFAALDAAPVADGQAAPTMVAATAGEAPVVTVPLPPTRPAFALAAAPEPAPAPGPVPAAMPVQALAFAPAPAAGTPFPTAAAPASVAAEAPAEAAEAAATPLPPRRPVEFRHFALRKPTLPAVSQTASALPAADAAKP
ncbi:MAG: transglycosylase SLT domain-containing protein [Methylobacterium frigidaeris]